MTRIETTGIVDENGMMTLSVPPSVLPGAHEVLVVIDHVESSDLPPATDNDALEQQGTRLVFTGELLADPESVRRSQLEERERRFIGEAHP